MFVQLCVATLLAFAPPLDLPAIFSDGLVLQADADVAVWGHAEEGRVVTVSPSWASKSVHGVADTRGRWLVRIATPAAGGPHSLRIACGADVRTIQDVMLGEVWLASGQSNMEMDVAPRARHLLGAIDWRDVVATSEDSGLRIFDVANTIAVDEADDVAGEWDAALPANTGRMSATAYFFARSLRDELGVPVGVITADWGGTAAESWTPANALALFPHTHESLARLHRAAAEPGGVSEAIARQRAEWWERVDELDAGVNGKWASASPDPEWERGPLPGTWENSGLAGHDGIVWYRRDVAIPERWRGEPLVVNLGPIDDQDVAYANGAVIGESRGDGLWATPREYEVPASLNSRGTLRLAIRVLDTGGPGGLHGEPGDMVLRCPSDPMRSVSLAGEWHRRAGVRLEDLPALPSLNHRTPSVLFNGMIAPLTDFTFRGVLWYQGESNRGRAAEYASLFLAMIEAWRARLGAPDLPFLFVQIAPFEYPGDRGQTARLRESQRRALRVPNTAMVVTTDVGDPADIHPRHKREVGERLALAARSLVYGLEDDAAMSPVAIDAVRDREIVRVRFSGAAGGLVGEPSVGDVEVQRETGDWITASARVDGQHMIIDAPGDAKAVRYLWDDTCRATVFNRRELPVSPFLEEIVDAVAD